MTELLQYTLSKYENKYGNFSFITHLALCRHTGRSFINTFAEKLAEGFHLSRYIVGFVVVSAISILPETFVSVDSALQGNPSFGIGTLLGSNVADLTLIFAILIFFAGKKGIRIQKSTLNKLLLYPLFLAIPLTLGFDGHFTRAEGLTLIIIGIIFYTLVFRRSVGITSRSEEIHHPVRNLILLVLSLGVLLAGAHFTVEAALTLAEGLHINPTLIGILIVGLGTTIPELFFSIKAIKHKKPEMAIGDIFGSVLADVTIVIGVVVCIMPVTFPVHIAYIAGGWMVASSIILLILMHTKYRLTRREGILLFIIWLGYIAAQVFASAH